MLNCEKCGREIGKNNYSKHFKSCDGNPIPKKKRIGRGKGWNKGKTYIEIYGSEKAQDIINRAKSSNNFLFESHTEETKSVISNKMKGNTNWKNSINKSGRGKKGNYKGEHFMSTWELAFIIYCEENNIQIKRNWKAFKYIDVNNEVRNYIPDFLREDGAFIEVKGYFTENVKRKIEQFEGTLIVYGKENMKPILNYVINKYSKDFYEILRDKNN